ncbi:hypothetical protein JCM10213_004966 [Rhodosporidiobolus nylandii]
MPKSQLLGTPIRSREERSTGAPSPFTPNPFRSSSGNREPPPPQPFGARTGSPLKQSAVLPSPPTASQTASQPDEPSSPSSSSFRQSSQPPQSSSQQVSRQKQRTEEELKAQARAAVLRTRIVADPSLSSAFRKEDDPELFQLFVG